MALTEFWMLHGFRPLEQIAQTLRETPELGALMPDFPERLVGAGHDHEARRGLLRELYSTVMTIPQEQVDLLLNGLLARLQAKPSRTRTAPTSGRCGRQRIFPCRVDTAIAESSAYTC